MAHLALALLGPFQASLDDLPVEGFTSPRLRALLAYLAVEGGREHLRGQVAALLWPEKPDREALGALRSGLSKLHSALRDRRAPCPFVLVTRTTVQFNTASDHWLDVAEFERLMQEAGGKNQDPDSCLQLLESCVALYRGPFLDGLSVGDSPAFDEWLLLKDEEYQRAVLSVLGRLASLRMARAEYSETARWARRQLELEPYRERAHRQLMAALALGGERSAALAHYEACRRLLAEELGCEPEDETQALYAQIRDGTLLRSQPTGRRGDTETRRRGELTPPAAHETHPSPPAKEREVPRFVAREQELARLGALLDQALAGQGGVALITGEAGSGKTALLDEWARRATQAHGDLIVLRGSCNAHGGAGDPYLPFREMLQTLAGDVEGKRAGGTLSAEQARRLWEALPVVGAMLVEHGPDLIGTFVSGEALLRRAEGFPALSPAKGRGPSGTAHWQAQLREIVRRAGQEATSVLPSALGAPALRPDLFVQVTQVLHAVSVSRPLLLGIDDLQWADGGTAALLFHLGRRLAGSRILLACAYRPEIDPPDPKGLERPLGSVLHELQREWRDILVDLDEADGRVFVEAYVDSEPNRLRAIFRHALYRRTGGNPLFTVELLRSFERDGMLVQDDAGQWVEAAGPDWERLPPQVDAVIAGHLAALPDEERVLLQAASVQGELFTAEVAARVLGWDEEAAVRRLGGPLRTQHRLVQGDRLERLASTGQRLSHYRFRHALVQGSAYRSLDAAERSRLHEATGRALEAVYASEGDRPQALAPALARHYEKAGLSLEAARQHLEAGRWAARLVAYDEAIAHLERGLVLLEGVPASGERRRLELALCLALVMPALLGRGREAPATTQALERLSDLTQHPDLQDDPQRLAALTMLAHGANWSADPERGRRVGEQLLGLVHDGDRQSLMLAHWVLAHSHWWQGQLLTAREHLEEALVLYDPEASRPLCPLLAGDPGVIGHTMLGFMLWLLGYPDKGRARSRQALARAEAMAEPSSIAFAQLLAGSMYLLLGRDVAAGLSHFHALRPLVGTGLIYGAWAELSAAQTRAPTEASGQAPTEASGQAHDGQAGARGAEPALERGLAQAAEAGSGLPAVGSGLGQAAHLLVQAQMSASAGQAEAGLATMDQALDWIEQTGVRVLEAEVRRMRGELLLQAAGGKMQDAVASDLHSGLASPFAEAEACFQRALEVARGQQARWFELRAAVSLARLWQGQGRCDEARGLLAGTYGWFTEGFDTVDLVEAKALLEQLG
jgi:DNA-binding SARP family transcriptional activator/tetratricopeptide (TPR) repeat protein